MDSPVFVENGQSAPINEREGVELVEAESTVGEEDDVTPTPQNADCIGADNSDQPDNVRNLNLVRNRQLLVWIAITWRMSAVKQCSYLYKSYLKQIPMFVGDRQGSRGHQGGTELGWMANLIAW